MVSALTVLLSCWLAGQSRVQGQEPLPKPSISASPGGVIPMGGHVTIRCWTEQLGMRVLLYKDEKFLTYTDPAGSEAEFPIASARREDGGNYTCRYGRRTGPAAYSVPSDPVQITAVEGTHLTEPRVTGSARPAPLERPDFTHGNIARLGLGAGVLLALGLILAEAYCTRPRGTLRSLDPSLQRRESPGGRAAAPRGAETPAQNPQPPNGPASGNLPPNSSQPHPGVGSRPHKQQ